ncbi:hypothetical protein WDZ92_04335 [Nostoc sp. NIES-2111]
MNPKDQLLAVEFASETFAQSLQELLRLAGVGGQETPGGHCGGKAQHFLRGGIESHGAGQAG